MKTERDYCDLHIHTTFSDGDYDLIEILKMCEKEKLFAISITDHDSVESCLQMQKLDVENYFGGKVMDGCEVRCVCKGIPIEILAYGFDVESFKVFIDKYNMTPDKDDIEKTKLLYKCFQNIDSNYFYPVEELLKRNDVWRYKELYLDAHRSQKILSLLKEENNDNNIMKFFRMGMNNPFSRFYCDVSGFYISVEKVLEEIHKSGGLAFLAHPCEYGENHKIVLKAIKDKLDGVECLHPSADDMSRKSLINYAKKHGLLISGGSDFHGFKGAINSQKVSAEVYMNIISKLKL